MMNNTPYGFSYGRSASNNKLMKLVSPNMMKIGRINSRALKRDLLSRDPGLLELLTVLSGEEMVLFVRQLSSTSMPRKMLLGLQQGQ